MSEEADYEQAVRHLFEWLKRASPPPTRTMDMEGALQTFREGTIDPDTPFDDRLLAVIAGIDRRLASIGSPPAGNGRWREAQSWGSQQTEELRDLAATLANASAWAQATLAEKDNNRRQHSAFQAGWEACAARAIDGLGEYARAGRTSIVEGRIAGDDQLDPRHHEIITEMARHLALGHSVNNAAKLAFEAGYGKSQKANKNRWDRAQQKRSRKKPPKAAKRR